MIFDRSIEAQFLIPMAVSMGFGILFTTVITLFLVPCALLLAQDVAAAVARTNKPMPT
jgi:multidrug efflux pump subunit AcrB